MPKVFRENSPSNFSVKYEFLVVDFLLTEKSNGL
jgi:hypothetical protein